MPIVSVIIATFNRASVIADAIHSVVNQSMRDWELVIADDGSTDETGEMVRALAARGLPHPVSPTLTRGANFCGVECSLARRAREIHRNPRRR